MSKSGFAGAGNSAGLELWRVERQLLVKQATVDGNLCSDNSYVILATTTPNNSDSLSHKIFLWSGQNSSLSENNIASQKANDLKDYLNCKNQIIEEIQSQESKQFVDCLKSVGGIRYNSKSRSNVSTVSHEGRIKSENQKLGQTLESNSKFTTVDDSLRPVVQMSILKRVIKESIVANPSEAHLKVLAFFTEAGIDEATSLRFRQCWSKVVLATQAFGRKAPKDTIPNPDLFADELIRELSHSDAAITRLLSMADLQTKTNTTIAIGEKSSAGDRAVEKENAQEVLRSLAHQNHLQKQLAKTLAEIYRTAEPLSTKEQLAATANDSRDDHALHVHSSMTMFRASLKGCKITWKGLVNSKTLATNAHYYPLDRQAHGNYEVYSGVLGMQKSVNNNNSSIMMHQSTLSPQQLPLYLSTTELTGIKVQASHFAHMEKAWCSYQCLNELLACQNLSLFPLPVGAQSGQSGAGGGGGLTLALESLPVKPLSSLLGPVLVTYLRKHPAIISLWCAQLVSAHTALNNYLTSGRLAKPIRLDSDVFVRENGTLLLGNLSFAEPLPLHAHGHAESDKNVSFLDFFSQLLSSALCLSRTETVSLLGNQQQGRNSGDSAIKLLSTSAGVMSSTMLDEDESLTEMVLSVMAGSTLELRVTGHKCTDVQIEVDTPSAVGATRSVGRGGVKSEVGSSSGALVNSVVSSSVLRARVQSENSNIATVNASPGSNSTGVLVQAHHPGVLSVHISAPNNMQDGISSTDDNKPFGRTSACTVRIIVVPAYAVAAVEVVELMGYLEEAQRLRWTQSRSDQLVLDSGSKNVSPSSVVLNAQCCSLRSVRKLNDALAADNSDSQHFEVLSRTQAALTPSVGLQRDWSEVSRAIDRLGTRSVEAQTAGDGERTGKLNSTDFTLSRMR